MKNIYSLLRFATRIRNPHVRMFGVWLMHITGRRYTGIFIDPVLGCNYRCKMCYFSDEKKRREMHGHFSGEQLGSIAKSLFHRALKLQIGCGAEPTLSKEMVTLIRLGKQYQVPYISVTTNGALLTRDWLRQMMEAGLDELTLSMHGTTRATYEALMVNGKFDRFLELLEDVHHLAPQFPSFRLRINYTMNEDNVSELAGFAQLLRAIPLHILQLRPIQQIGESAYENFSLDRIRREYDTVLQPLIAEYRAKGVTVLAPEKADLDQASEGEAGEDVAFEKATYLYVSPRHCWQADFDYETETFESYARRAGIARKLFFSIFTAQKRKQANVTRKMKYSL
ncbi:MAG: radical SAM protein [Bacteroidales bacterium]